jgi:GT2 family glycosyltransferase
MNPAISVVVPVRDGERRLPALLGSLAAQTLARERFEIVVVDNASRDLTAEAARTGGANTVVSEPVPGRARARNAGVAAASADRIAFVDADCSAQPGWLEALAGCLERSPLAAGPVNLLTGSPPARAERLEALWRFKQAEHVERDGWAASANLGIRRDAFAAVGGFDVAYERIGEDVDLCLRARSAGYGLAYCPDAAVDHAAETRVATVLRRGVAHGWSSNQHFHRLPGEGWRHWRHPLPALRGDWALRRFGVDPAEIPASERRRLLRLARAEYAARVAGSAWAEVRRAR